MLQAKASEPITEEARGIRDGCLRPLRRARCFRELDAWGRPLILLQASSEVNVLPLGAWALSSEERSLPGWCKLLSELR